MITDDLTTLRLPNKSAIDVLTEIAVLCEQSVEALACFRQFIDAGPIVAPLDVDLVRTMIAGKYVVLDKPRKGLTRCLEAVRAAYAKGNALGCN